MPINQKQLNDLIEFFNKKAYIADAEQKYLQLLTALETKLNPFKAAITEYQQNLELLTQERDKNGITSEGQTEIELKTKLSEIQLHKESLEKELRALSREKILEEFQAKYATEFLDQLEKMQLKYTELKSILQTQIIQTTEQEQELHDIILVKDTKRSERKRSFISAIKTIVATIDRAQSRKRASLRLQQSPSVKPNTPLAKISADFIEVQSEGEDSDDCTQLKEGKYKISVKKITSSQTSLPIVTLEPVINEFKILYANRPIKQASFSESIDQRKKFTQDCREFADNFYLKLSETNLEGENLKFIIQHVIGNEAAHKSEFYENFIKNLSPNIHSYKIRTTIRSLFLEFDHLIKAKHKTNTAARRSRASSLNLPHSSHSLLQIEPSRRRAISLTSRSKDSIHTHEITNTLHGDTPNLDSSLPSAPLVTNTNSDSPFISPPVVPASSCPVLAITSPSLSSASEQEVKFDDVKLPTVNQNARQIPSVTVTTNPLLRQSGQLPSIEAEHHQRSNPQVDTTIILRRLRKQLNTRPSSRQPSYLPIMQTDRSAQPSRDPHLPRQFAQRSTRNPRQSYADIVNQTFNQAMGITPRFRN